MSKRNTKPFVIMGYGPNNFGERIVQPMLDKSSRYGGMSSPTHVHSADCAIAPCGAEDVDMGEEILAKKLVVGARLWGRR